MVPPFTGLYGLGPTKLNEAMAEASAFTKLQRPNIGIAIGYIQIHIDIHTLIHTAYRGQAQGLFLTLYLT